MASRKLQTEIDRTLKKVAEGVEVFEDIYEKLLASASMPQKEKLEQDLKKEIKKLQRLRDQIKTWAGSNEIKDKKPLLENRKLIETQMERFKAVEKEMKTKAYSKEGLSAASRLDPKEKEKMEVSNWLTNTVDELDRQVEALEAEAETLQGGMKKTKKDSSKAERLADIEHRIERHKWHQGKLELILRLLENGTIDPETIKNLKEDIQYYVDSCQEDEDFEEDEGIYDDLNLEEEEEAFGLNDNDVQSSREDSVTDNEPKTPIKDLAPKKQSSLDERNGSIDEGNDKSPLSPANKISFTKPAVLPPVRKPTAETQKVPARTPSIPEPPSPAKLSNGPLPKGPTMAAAAARGLPSTTTGEPIRYAAAAAAAAAATSAPASSSSGPPPTTTAMKTEPPKPPTQTSITSQPVSQSPVNDAPLNDSIPAPELTSSPAAKSPSPAPISSAERQQNEVNAAAAEIQDVPLQRMENVPNVATSSTTSTSSSAEIKLPSSLADLVAAFEVAKQKALVRQDESAVPSSYVHDMLEGSFQNVPDAMDSDRPKYYTPRNPFPTPQHYPQQPPPIFDNPTLFEKFDIDTLFYIFYYQQGTYQQYLAARELRKQSWRFHKKYLTWFQRHEEPKAITDEYEQGTYIYFDFEGSWVQRKKTEFRFEYRYLEDELV